ncbi:MAG: DNA-binding response regulator [Spongiibacteraceae bacterium]|jgi:DNA-binding response OmpR family regulator/DNA-binding CsgD family transcriptional regulator|nr:DNA-binding response regulator [Spongiibacteraceae bacterium]
MNLSVNEVALVVDDSPDTLSLLNDALEGAGLSVLLALDGQQALTIASKVIPDIILLDAIMPNMDGFETCRRLKANPALAEIPVIFMTGLTDTEHVVEGLEAGGVDYLTKPVSPDELLARVRVHLGNAKRTMSVQQALDRTGQYLITLDKNGTLQWATREAQALLKLSGLSAAEQEKLIFTPLVRWLSHGPQRGQRYSLENLPKPLDVFLLSDSSDIECLFRLSDPASKPDADTLRRVLPLTQRESEVLYWIAQGKTNKEIGEILAMSPRTVNKHLETVFPKLGVENRTAAAAAALKVLTR